jgi:hypothetical protein
MEPFGSIDVCGPWIFPWKMIPGNIEQYQAAQRKVFGVRPNQRLQAR